MHLPLNDECLELTKRCSRPKMWSGKTDERSNVCDDIPPGGVKDQSVNGFAEVLVPQECCDDECGAE